MLLKNLVWHHETFLRAILPLVAEEFLDHLDQSLVFGRPHIEHDVPCDILVESVLQLMSEPSDGELHEFFSLVGLARILSH